MLMLSHAAHSICKQSHPRMGTYRYVLLLICVSVLGLCANLTTSVSQACTHAG